MREPTAPAYYDRRAPEYDDWYLGRGLYADRDRAGFDDELADVRTALAALAPAATLDVACGTGFLTRHLPGAVTGLDQSRRMLRVAAEQAPAATLVEGDALSLPFADGGFDGATVSFGLRNVADLDQALRELRRVLRPGGRLAVLEFAVPTLPGLRQLYLLYFRRILPAVGRLLSDRGSAYAYLPSSVLEFPQRDGFVARMANAGFVLGRATDLAGGVVCLYQGERP